MGAMHAFVAKRKEFKRQGGGKGGSCMFNIKATWGLILEKRCYS